VRAPGYKVVLTFETGKLMQIETIPE